MLSPGPQGEAPVPKESDMDRAGLWLDWKETAAGSPQASACSRQGCLGSA